MFEILQVYETASHEKNKFLRYIYTKYVRHKMKSTFFNKFKSSMNTIKPDKNLLEEFKQFYLCTNKAGKHIEGNPRVFYISSYNSIYIDYYNYNFRFSFLISNCDIEITNTNFTKDKSIVIHPEYDELYSSFWSEIILSAIYNYCVLYIYGKDSNLYIDNDLYIEKVKSIYF